MTTINLSVLLWLNFVFFFVSGGGGVAIKSKVFDLASGHHDN